MLLTILYAILLLLVKIAIQLLLNKIRPTDYQTLVRFEKFCGNSVKLWLSEKSISVSSLLSFSVSLTAGVDLAVWRELKGRPSSAAELCVWRRMCDLPLCWCVFTACTCINVYLMFSLSMSAAWYHCLRLLLGGLVWLLIRCVTTHWCLGDLRGYFMLFLALSLCVCMQEKLSEFETRVMADFVLQSNSELCTSGFYCIHKCVFNLICIPTNFSLKC